MSVSAMNIKKKENEVPHISIYIRIRAGMEQNRQSCFVLFQEDGGGGGAGLLVTLE
jgi:hypothetical protein